MAKAANLLMLLSMFVVLAPLAQGADDLIRKIRPGKEKVTRLSLYYHNVEHGDNPTTLTVAQAANSANSPTAFGMVKIIDNPLTIRPDPKSKLVGRAHGLYAYQGAFDFDILMVVDLAFTDGIYNGSTLNIVGRNHNAVHVRDTPIVGGTGVFAFARGIATISTYFLNLTSGLDVILLFNLTITNQHQDDKVIDHHIRGTTSAKPKTLLQENCKQKPRSRILASNMPSNSNPLWNV
ncbi:Dirigent protein [Dillenia turbinata]|uniref:Dirigent protein n=1 Tax=Dillenia turbinata TaxID=194707 RepID=A0AAN8WDL8_9MAGN